MLKKYQKLTTFDLKIIGIILMVIDHIHEMFVPFGVPQWLNWFGRPVATIFFFVSAIGFSYTRNKKKYLLQLLIGMVVMNLGNDLLGRLIPYDAVLINNIFKDLLVGALMMSGIDFFRKFRQNKKIKTLATGIFLFLLPVLASLVVLFVLGDPSLIDRSPYVAQLILYLPAILLTENGLYVFIIPLLYVFKDRRGVQCLLIGIAAIIFAVLGSTQWMIIFAALLILLYNGQKGKGLKYFFYLFYPAHIWLLYLLAAFLYSIFQ